MVSHLTGRLVGLSLVDSLVVDGRRLGLADRFLALPALRGPLRSRFGKALLL